MIFYISDLYKKFVTRNNAFTSKPVKIFNHTVDEIEVSIVDQQNQLKQIPSGAFYFTGSFVKKAKATPIFLSTDYTVSGTTLTFKYSTYTYEFLNLVIGENVPIQVEIGYKDADGEHVILQDTAYASQRYYVEGMPDPSHVAEYYTKTETDAAIQAAISGIELSGYATEEQLEEGLATKQNTIDEENKLPYSLISDTPTIPLSTSQLTNDSGFITETALEGLATEAYVNEAVSGKADETALSTHTSDTTIHVTAEDKETWNGKQDAITVDNKLDYALLSGTPEVPTVEWGGISGTLSAQTDLQNALNGKANASDIPLSTSQLTNDSNFVTSSEMDDALSGKQDLITESEWLPATYVRMDIDHWQGDPDFDVAAAVNMTRDDVYAVSGVVSGLLSSKQDAITNDNKLDYGLLSGTPSIPLSTSELINDSDFQTSTDVANAISGKAEQTDVDEISGELEECDDELLYFIDDNQELNEPLTFVIHGTCNFGLVAEGTPSTQMPSLQYSFDKVMWKTLTSGTVQYTDTTIYIRGENDTFNYGNAYNYWRFEVSGDGTAEVHGNLMSIIDRIGETRTIPENVVLNHIFVNDKITSAPILPALHLTNSCYSNMFRGCQLLKKAPALPAEYLTYNCYGGMFNNCIGLLKTPKLPSKHLANECYNWMFNNCSSLAYAEDLPAETAAYHCYTQMFQGCRTLKNAPKIHLVTLAQECCNVMFWNCSNLEGPIVLPATTLLAGCYGGMFNSCVKLNDITVGFSSWNGNATGNWVYNTASTGTFRCPSGLDTTTRGNATIPANWSIVNI